MLINSFIILRKPYFCCIYKIETMKYKYSFILGLLGWLITGCQSIEPLSIDYMLPAEISFPAELRKVAVVNNMAPPASKDFLIKQEETTTKDTEVPVLTQFFQGNARITSESLAENLAKGNYFDEVIICDSALLGNSQPGQEAMLSDEKVEILTQELGADMLIAVEDIQIKATRKVKYSPFYQAYFGTTDLKVHPTVRIYLPGRKAPLSTLHANDSIFWEETGASFAEAEARLINNKDLVEQASDFAGSTPVKQLLPHWQSAHRYLFTGGCVEMRDAAVYVREKNWKDAIPLWEQMYEGKKGKKKMQAAHNLALGYEMQDQLDQALEWARKARKIAFEIDKVEQKKNPQGIEADNVPNYALESLYVAELEKRNTQTGLLNMQMKRFNE